MHVKVLAFLHPIVWKITVTVMGFFRRQIERCHCHYRVKLSMQSSYLVSHWSTVLCSTVAWIVLLLLLLLSFIVMAYN